MIDNGLILNGTYQIIEEIGSGGGGVVYRAQHLRLDIPVVVKRIKDEVVGAIAARGEADILKNLKHPYLPRIYDFIECEDGIYTVMDYIPGWGLDTLIAEGNYFSQKQIIKWAKQLGEAIAYLHSQKPEVIHSDIKPSNIIITPDGDVCLIDFNISTVSEGGRRLSVGFSAGYSAPEQYRTRLTPESVPTSALLDTNPEYYDDETEVLQEFYDENLAKRNAASRGYRNSGIAYSYGYVDKRSDIYSLGCVLYHLATGYSPGRDFRNVVPVHEMYTEISEGLIVIIEKMMQINPDKRYQSGKEFLKAIENCYKLDHRFIVQRTKERVLLSLACIFLIVGGGFIGGGLSKIKQEEEIAYREAMDDADELADKGKFDKALKQIEECQGMKRSDGEAYQKEVYYLFLSGDYDACIERAEEILSKQLLSSDSEKENLGKLLYILGNAAYEKEDYAYAAECFDEATKQSQKNALYFRDLCISHARLGHLDKAGKALDKAIKYGLTEDSIYFARGEIERAQGNDKEAFEAFDKVLDMTDDAMLRKRAVLIYSKMLLDNGQINEDIELLEKALKQADNNERLVLKDALATAYMRLAESTEDENEAIILFDKAASLYEELIDEGFATWQSKENLAILRENAHQFDKAKEVLFGMLEDYPDDYRVYKRLAFLEAKIQQNTDKEYRDYSLMKEYYDKAVSLYDESINEQEMQMLANLIADLRSANWLD